MTETEIKRAHLFISGRVQGVNFRYYTRQQAQILGIRGWVRNLIDGRVEAMLEGDGASMERMIHWCQHGPRASRVDSVEIFWEEPTGEFSGFDVRHSYGWV